MSKRRERKIKDLCDVTPTLSEPQITPILTGNLRMKGPVDEANGDLVNHMAASQISESFNDLNRSQKIDHSGVRGTCNVCSAPCSSCSHADKFVMKSNYEASGEACADNIAVTEITRQYESGQTSEVSTVAGILPTSNSFSEDVIGKGSSRVSEASASDDNASHSHSRHAVTEGHDDCLSCATTDEMTSKKRELENNYINYSSKCNFGRESPDKVAPKSLTGVYSEEQTPNLKSMDDATVLVKNQSEASKEDEKYDDPSDTKDKPLGSPTQHLNPVPTGEAENGAVCRDPPVLTTKSITKNEELDMEVPHADKAEDLDMEVLHTDEAEDSDMEELDVNICDICGDAGREHLLAICSQCSEGAEHTYCMRTKLDEVPEGEWLCEECKAMERVGNERQDKIEKLDEKEKVNIFAQRTSERGNRTNVELYRAKGKVKPPGKRSRDDSDAEFSSIVKKPAIEQTVGSPKAKTLQSTNSFKNQNKGRLQSLRLASSNNVRGTFSKSNSFNGLASKPKAKLVDHVVLQKQKPTKEHATFRPKDGVTRSLGKSLSFKSTVSNSPESRTKLISPRLAHIPDKRNLKDRSLFERQRSFRNGQPLTELTVGTSKSSTSRFEKLTSSSRESSSPTALTSQREKNPGNADGKSVPTVSRSSSFVARRTTESSSSLGEFKRPPLRSHSTVGVSSSANAANDIGQKSVRAGLKEDVSCGVASECPPCNSNDGVFNAAPRVRDIANSADRLRDSMKLSKDGPRKFGVCRKDAILDQSDVKSATTATAEASSHQDHISCSTGKKILNSDVEHIEKTKLPGNLVADSIKPETIHNLNKSSFVKSEGFFSGGAFSRVPSPRDAFNDAPVAVPFFLKSTAIPEHEYIWQGSFEIRRSGRTFELWDGIQAHLSTYASSKVVDAVNTLESRIVLYEVPRLSIWPVQFRDHGVREDNIAIFFFAKDIASYNRNYKVLVDKMMTNDLALKGTVNGVELLIFPSSQLPDSMKRWNMLFFIWGVFRGKRGPPSQQIPNSSSQPRAPEGIPQAIMSFPESKCSSVPLVTKSSGSDDEVKVLPAFEKGESPSLLASGISNEDCRTKIQTLVEPDRLNCAASDSTQNNDTKSCQDMEVDGQEVDIRPLPKDTRSSDICPTEKDIPVCQSQSLQLDLNSATGNDNMAPEEGITNRKTPDSTLKIEQLSIVKEDKDSSKSKDGETHVRRKPELRDLNMDPPDICISSTEESTHLESSSNVPHEHKGHLLPSVSTHYNENPERHLFPIESKPAHHTRSVEKSSPWKVDALKQDRLHDRVPDLNLSLETECNNMSTQPMLGVKNVRDDDESASLSLSLSFPFPEREQRSEHGPKIEQHLSDGKRVNKKTLFSL